MHFAKTSHIFVSS